MPAHNTLPLEKAILPDEKLVTVVVPKAYNLALDDTRTVLVGAGVQDVPEVVADHWWSKANGVIRYVAKKAPAPPPAKPLSKAEAKALADAEKAAASQDAPPAA